MLMGHTSRAKWHAQFVRVAHTSARGVRRLVRHLQALVGEQHLARRAAAAAEQAVVVAERRAVTQS